MFVIAVGLLVFDTLVTSWLWTRRRRRRRAAEVAHRRVSGTPTRAAELANADLARRQAIVQARSKSLHPTAEASSTPPVRALPRGIPVPPFFAMRRDAEHLASITVLVYDPAVWET